MAEAPELLAPAGDREGLREAAALAHARGAKLYLWPIFFTSQAKK